MRRSLIAAMLFSVTAALAQVGPYLRPSKINMPHGATRPATCVVGDEFRDDSQTPGQNVYYCTATNTWSQQGGGGSGLPVAANVAYLSDATYDFAIGGSTFATSACYVDESADLLQCGGTTSPLAFLDGVNALLGVQKAGAGAGVKWTDSTASKSFLMNQSGGIVGSSSQPGITLWTDDTSTGAVFGATQDGDGTFGPYVLFPLNDYGKSGPNGRIQFGQASGAGTSGSTNYKANMNFVNFQTFKREKLHRDDNTAYGLWISTDWDGSSVMDTNHDGTIDTTTNGANSNLGLTSYTLYIEQGAQYNNVPGGQRGFYAQNDALSGHIGLFLENEYNAAADTNGDGTVNGSDVNVQQHMDISGGSFVTKIGNDANHANAVYGRVRDMYGVGGAVGLYSASDIRDTVGVFGQTFNVTDAGDQTITDRGTQYGIVSRHTQGGSTTQADPSVVGIRIVKPSRIEPAIGTHFRTTAPPAGITSYTGLLIDDMDSDGSVGLGCGAGSCGRRAAYFGGDVFVKSAAGLWFNGTMGAFDAAYTGTNGTQDGNGGTYKDGSGLRGFKYNPAATGRPAAVDTNAALYFYDYDGTSTDLQRAMFFSDTDGTASEIAYTGEQFLTFRKFNASADFLKLDPATALVTQTTSGSSAVGITQNFTAASSTQTPLKAVNSGSGITMLEFDRSGDGSTSSIRHNSSGLLYFADDADTTLIQFPQTVSNPLVSVYTDNQFPRVTATTDMRIKASNAHYLILKNGNTTDDVTLTINVPAAGCGGGTNGGLLNCTGSAGALDCTCGDDDGGAGGGGDNTQVGGNPTTDLNIIASATVTPTLDTGPAVDTVALAVVANSIGPTQIDETASYTHTGSDDYSGAKLELPNSTTLPTTDCDDAAEAGRTYVDSDATTGKQFYICEGAAGWKLQGGANDASPYITSAGDTSLSAEKVLTGTATVSVTIDTAPDPDTITLAVPTGAIGPTQFDDTANYTETGQWSFSGAEILGGLTPLRFEGAVDNGVYLNLAIESEPITSTKTVSFPNATTVLVGRDTPDTLTNKTLTAPVIATISNGGTVTVPTGAATLATTANIAASASTTNATYTVHSGSAPATGDGFNIGSSGTPITFLRDANGNMALSTGLVTAADDGERGVEFSDNTTPPTAPALGRTLIHTTAAHAYVLPNGGTTPGGVVITGTGVATYGPVLWAAASTSCETACVTNAKLADCVDAYPMAGGAAVGCASTTAVRVCQCN